MNIDRLADWMSALSDDMVAVFETSRGCISVSPNWQRLTGQPVEATYKDGFYQFLHPEQRKAFITALQAAVCEPRERVPCQDAFQLRCADGNSRWFRLIVGEVEPAEGIHQQVICCLKDIQAVKQAEQRLARIEQEMRIGQRARTEALNTINHDLRTPLNAILGFTQIMESGIYGEINTPQYREYLRHVRESGYELLTQIDMLLAAMPTPTPRPAKREALAASAWRW